MAQPCEAVVWVGTKGFCCGGTRVQPWRLVLVLARLTEGEGTLAEQKCYIWVIVANM
jgi:hypothetical protein